MFFHDIRVYYEDTDAGGVVYYAGYLKFAERARTEYLRQAGLTHGGLQDRFGVLILVKSLSVDYLKPARLDDLLAVSAMVSELGGASFRMAQEIARGTEILARLDVRLACVDAGGRACRLPAVLRGILKT